MPIKNTGKEFERFINHIMGLLTNATVEYDVKRIGVQSGRVRQIDNLIKGNLGPIPVEIEVECKDYNSPVSIDKLESFAQKTKDTGVNFGILVSSGGFDKSLVGYANKTNILLMEPLGYGIKNLIMVPIGYIIPRITSYNYGFSSQGHNDFRIPLFRTQDEMNDSVRFKIGDGLLSMDELVIHNRNIGNVKQEKGDQSINLNAMSIIYLPDDKHVYYAEVKITVLVDEDYYLGEEPIFGLKSISDNGEKRNYSLRINLSEVESNAEKVSSLEELTFKLKEKSKGLDIQNMIVQTSYIIGK